MPSLPGLARRVPVYTGPRAFRSRVGIEIRPAPRFAAAGHLWP